MHYFDGMKAVTINISLNPELADFARSDSEAHAFDSMSEYMRDLIRNRRQEQIKQDVALFGKGHRRRAGWAIRRMRKWPRL